MEVQTYNLILCGLGGQGILFMTRVLAYSAMLKDLVARAAETHGMAQRGGSVISHFKVGEAESPTVRRMSAHFLLSLDETEMYRNLSYIRPNGSIFLNCREPEHIDLKVKDYVKDNHISLISLDATRIAKEYNMPLSTNIALLGAFASFVKEPFGKDDLRQAVSELSKDIFRDKNIAIFEKGMVSGIKVI